MTVTGLSVVNGAYALSSDSELNLFLEQVQGTPIKSSSLQIMLNIPTLAQRALENLIATVNQCSDEGYIYKLEVMGGEIEHFATAWVKVAICFGCSNLKSVFLPGAKEVMIHHCSRLMSAELFNVTEICLTNVPQLEYLDAPNATKCAVLSSIGWFNQLKVLKIRSYSNWIDLQHHRQLEVLDARGAGRVSGLRYARSDLKMKAPERRRIPKPRDVAWAVSWAVVSFFSAVVLASEMSRGEFSPAVFPLFVTAMVTMMVAYRSLRDELIPSYYRLRY